jgi:phosphoribosyl 1,2-cyclic phosphodiesterase
MSLQIASLNSGSNGNCYYIGNQEEAVLVDAGISCKEIEKRMKRLELSMGRVKAIFVSHEHGDHIMGLPVLAKKYQLPVYITNDTLRTGGIKLEDHLTVSFRAYDPVRIGALSVTAFPKFHDACDPHSFIVAGQQVKVGIFTDIGQPCEHVINHFQQCHAAFLEANYDEALLQSGRYPYYLKNRIRGGKGHLSNEQAFRLFISYRPSFMSHLLLSHLSRDNNDPVLVRELFNPVAQNTEIIIASRYKETPVYEITNTTRQVISAKIISVQSRPLQLSLFK